MLHSSPTMHSELNRQLDKRLVLVDNFDDQIETIERVLSGIDTLWLVAIICARQNKTLNGL